jgi:hypothetical protein
MSPHVVLGLSRRSDVVRQLPSAIVQQFPDRDHFTRTPSNSASTGVSRDNGLKSARLSEKDGSKMYVELARESENARRTAFSMVIGYATEYQHSFSATAGPVQGARI